MRNDHLKMTLKSIGVLKTDEQQDTDDLSAVISVAEHGRVIDQDDTRDLSGNFKQNKAA